MKFAELYRCLPLDLSDKLFLLRGQAASPPWLDLDRWVEEAEPLIQTEVEMMSYDTRADDLGQVFFALPGRTVDASRYIPQALTKGVRIVCGQAEPGEVSEICGDLIRPDRPCLYLKVADARLAMALLSANLYGAATEKLTVIGITGTKGKTSVAHLVNQLLQLEGYEPLLVGTTGINFKGQTRVTDNTTPESMVIQEEAARALAGGASHLVIELSSQALEMQRTGGLATDLVCFLNLAHDHIGPLEHPTYEAYRDAKAKAFKGAKTCLINLDDDQAEFMFKKAREAGTIETYAAFTLQADPSSDLARVEAICGEPVRLCQAEKLTYSSDYVEFLFKGLAVRLQPAASFEAINGLVSLAIMDLLGLWQDRLCQVLAKLSIPGRLESITAPNGARVIIDYAHNEMSLKALLQALRPQVSGRLILVFGSVGERSQERRKELAQVAEANADLVYVSSDNPGLEDPGQIVDEIASHFSSDFHSYHMIPDRELAIRRAVRDLKPGDTLVLAGKGHERFQLIGRDRVPFNEREIVESEFRVIANSFSSSGHSKPSQA